MKNDVTIENNELNERKKIILYFFIYAFLGWLLETVFCVVTLGKFMKRGFLFGPLCPMYGFAAVSMIRLIKKIKTNTVGKFCICMIAFTVFEYVVAVVLESIFGLKWWDYSNERFNFQGRISLPYSIAWGIIGTIFIEKIHPYISSKLSKHISKISNSIQETILNLFVILIIIDFVLSILKYTNVLF